MCLNKVTFSVYGQDGHLDTNEAWKPLPECLMDDVWPCTRPPGWPATWLAPNVLSKPRQPRPAAAEGAKGEWWGGDLLLADPHAEEP